MKTASKSTLISIPFQCNTRHCTVFHCVPPHHRTTALTAIASHRIIPQCMMRKEMQKTTTASSTATHRSLTIRLVLEETFRQGLGISLNFQPSFLEFHLHLRRLHLLDLDFAQFGNRLGLALLLLALAFATFLAGRCLHGGDLGLALFLQFGLHLFLLLSSRFRNFTTLAHGFQTCHVLLVVLLGRHLHGRTFVLLRRCILLSAIQIAIFHDRLLLVLRDDSHLLFRGLRATLLTPFFKVLQALVALFDFRSRRRLESFAAAAFVEFASCHGCCSIGMVAVRFVLCFSWCCCMNAVAELRPARLKLWWVE
mmetsp:Transcript_17592/g.48830  ORF Transcript_17592/g.48830 Transcript_17592/m.48830 type:complete len:310 (-) Transcript_17592:25-954(-)